MYRKTYNINPQTIEATTVDKKHKSLYRKMYQSNPYAAETKVGNKKEERMNCTNQHQFANYTKPVDTKKNIPQKQQHQLAGYRNKTR